MRQTATAAQARDILAAWERRDRQALAAELARAETLCAATLGASSAEQERMDLLGGIVSRLARELAGPVWSRPSGSADVCFRLLKHLAGGRRTPDYSI